jgi:hypothetical protein
MDTYLLRLYQEQVASCCKAVLLGYEDIQSGLAEGGNRERTWYGVQNLIIGAGNLSKALWGAGERRHAERQPLRDSLSVTDSSPLRQVKIRNDYEHLDERLEVWWEESTNHNIVGRLIGPRGTVGGEGFGEKDVLRWLDPTTGDVIFWGNELNIAAVVGEVERILPIAETESVKPHWDDQSRTSEGGE